MGRPFVGPIIGDHKRSIRDCRDRHWNLPVASTKLELCEWHVMQVTFSIAIEERLLFGSMALSPEEIPMPLWQRTQKVPNSPRCHLTRRN